jgi:hypothetical protein
MMGKIYLWLSIKRLWKRKNKGVVKTKNLRSSGFLINGIILIEKWKNKRRPKLLQLLQ